MSIQQASRHGAGAIRRDSAIPLYVQIGNALIDAIRRGEYAPEAPLPAEKTLADMYGVTRMTIRQALAALREGGFIATDKGRGSRVTGSRIEQSLLRFYSFGRRFREAGRAFSSRVIDAGVVDPQPDIVARFVSVDGDSRPDRRFHQIVRVRVLDGTPLILERAIIPVDVAPGITDRDLERESIYDVLERDCGQVVSGATEYLEPRVVHGEDARILEIDDGAAVFYTERETRNAAGDVIEVRISLIRGDKIRFSTELTLGAEFPHAYQQAGHGAGAEGNGAT